MAVASHSHVASIEKLDGRDNYTDWKFAVKAYMEHEGLWDCVLGTETDADKMIKAKSKLILLIKPANFTHIQTCNSAKAIWDALSTAFNDSGLSRRVSLMRTLTSARLEQCTGMESYVNLIMHTVHKLRGIGCNVDEDWIGTFLLAGLPDTYQPMIMAVENSGIAITGDSIKTRLLQEPTVNSNRVHSSSALSTVGRFNNDRRGPRCFICNEYGHIAVQCRKQRQEDVSETANRTASSNTNRQGAKSSYATGLFAGFVGQGNVNRIIDSDASGSVHNRLHKKSIGHTTQSNNDYDPYRYVYVDDVFSFSSNSNLVGEEKKEENCAITNSNSVVTERQGSDFNNFECARISEDLVDSDDDIVNPYEENMEYFFEESSDFKGF